MPDQELVTGFELSEAPLGLVELGDLGELPEIEIILAEQLVERVAAPDRQRELLQRRRVDSIDQYQWNLAVNTIRGFFGRDLRHASRGHCRFLRRRCDGR